MLGHAPQQGAFVSSEDLHDCEPALAAMHNGQPLHNLTSGVSLYWRSEPRKRIRSHHAGTRRFSELSYAHSVVSPRSNLYVGLKLMAASCSQWNTLLAFISQRS